VDATPGHKGRGDKLFKATLIYRRTGNLWAVQLLLAHSKLKVGAVSWG